jgi:hypothetical protein
MLLTRSLELIAIGLRTVLWFCERFSARDFAASCMSDKTLASYHPVGLPGRDCGIQGVVGDLEVGESVVGLLGAGKTVVGDLGVVVTMIGKGRVMSG